jgi:hypothetical protein
LEFLKNQSKATEFEDGGNGPKVGAKIGSDDILHILGHGHNLEGSKLDANLDGKPSIEANTLADRVKTIIDTAHRLIMLDCCFAMGQYFGKKWWEGKSTEFLGKVLALALGHDHTQLIIGGSVNAVTSPQPMLSNSPVGYAIGTAFTVNSQTTAAFADRYYAKGNTMIVPRLLYYLNHLGNWVNADGSAAAGPQNLW